jgi:hypothetical protein
MCVVFVAIAQSGLESRTAVDLFHITVYQLVSGNS